MGSRRKLQYALLFRLLPEGASHLGQLARCPRPQLASSTEHLHVPAARPGPSVTPFRRPSPVGGNPITIERYRRVPWFRIMSGRSRRLTTPPKTLPRRPHRPHPEIRQSGSVWGCSGLTGVDAAIAPWKSCLEVLAVTRRAALFRRSLPRGSGRGAYTWDIKRNLHRLQAFFDERPPLSGL